jgi:hypothetical protein
VIIYQVITGICITEGIQIRVQLLYSISTEVRIIIIVMAGVEGDQEERQMGNE